MMIKSMPHMARIVAWDSFLSRHCVSSTAGRLLISASPRWVCSAATKPPSFDNAAPKRAQQAYFKGKAATADKSKLPGARSSGNAKPSQPGTPSTEVQRLSKVMAAAGVASRRACEELIEKGEVKVNGKVVSQQGTMINPESDQIQVSGKKLVVFAKPNHYYFMVNKPKGYICSNVESVEGRGKRVVDLLAPWMSEWDKRHADKGGKLPPRFFTVGRLDVASHGLILVTNDGHWANKVIHPSAEVTKEYIVMVDKIPRRSHLEVMLTGADVDGTHVVPLEVSVLEGSTKLRVIVGEGKKHEVRILVAAAGLEVLSLKRVRIGGLRVPPTLGLGGFREMTASEMKDVTNLTAQDKLRKQAWASASMLMLKEGSEVPKATPRAPRP